jgi:hypothetical protein
VIKLVQLVFEFSLGALALLFVILQVFIPLFKGTPVFPWLRRLRGRSEASDKNSSE